MRQESSLKMAVYHGVLNGIISGEYKPGQILNEPELVDKYGCSKAPVREALIALCNEEVLKNIPRFGYEVVRLTREDVAQILDFRLILEGGSLRRSYGKIGDEEIQELSQMDLLCREETADMWDHWDRNKKFHLKLLSYSRNTYAYTQLDRSMDILKRAYAQFYWNKWSSSVVTMDIKCHSQLIESLKKGQIEEAVSVLEADLKDFGIE